MNISYADATTGEDHDGDGILSFSNFEDLFCNHSLSLLLLD